MEKKMQETGLMTSKYSIMVNDENCLSLNPLFCPEIIDMVSRLNSRKVDKFSSNNWLDEHEEAICG